MHPAQVPGTSQAWKLSPGSLLKWREVLLAPGLWAIRDGASSDIPKVMNRKTQPLTIQLSFKPFHLKCFSKLAAKTRLPTPVSSSHLTPSVRETLSSPLSFFLVLKHPGGPEWGPLLLPQEVAIPEGLLSWSAPCQGWCDGSYPTATWKPLAKGGTEISFLLSAEGTWGSWRLVSPFVNRMGSIIFEARCKVKMWAPWFKNW